MTIDQIRAKAPQPIRAWMFPAVTLDGTSIPEAVVRFVRKDGAPGFRYLGVVNDQRVCWISDECTPCESTAKFVWSRWAEGRTA